MAIKARDERAGELDKLERECRYRLGQANLKYNEALVRHNTTLVIPEGFGRGVQHTHFTSMSRFNVVYKSRLCDCY